MGKQGTKDPTLNANRENDVSREFQLEEEELKEREAKHKLEREIRDKVNELSKLEEALAEIEMGKENENDEYGYDNDDNDDNEDLKEEEEEEKERGFFKKPEEDFSYTKDRFQPIYSEPDDSTSTDSVSLGNLEDRVRKMRLSKENEKYLRRFRRSEEVKEYKARIQELKLRQLRRKEEEDAERERITNQIHYEAKMQLEEMERVKREIQVLME